jgi:hypothetical protein
MKFHQYTGGCKRTPVNQVDLKGRLTSGGHCVIIQVLALVARLFDLQHVATPQFGVLIRTTSAARLARYTWYLIAASTRSG